MPEPLLQRVSPSAKARPVPPRGSLALRKCRVIGGERLSLGKSLLVGLGANQLDSRPNENWLIHGTQHVDQSRFRQFRKCVLDAMGLTDAEIPVARFPTSNRLRRGVARPTPPSPSSAVAAAEPLTRPTRVTGNAAVAASWNERDPG